LEGLEFLHPEQYRSLFEALTLIDVPSGETGRLELINSAAENLGPSKRPVLLSSEHFIMPGNWLATPVSQPVVRLDSPQILSYLDKLGDDLRILLVIRRQLDWLESWYQERIKRYETRKFHDVLKAPEFEPIMALLQFDLLFLDLAERFGKENIFVVPFELLKTDPEKFIRGVSEAAGLPSPDLKLPKVRGRINPRVLNARRASNKFLTGVAGFTGGQTPIDHGLFKVFKKFYAYDFLIGRGQPGRYDFGPLPDEQISLFSRSNRNFEDISGLDLKALGYY